MTTPPAPWVVVLARMFPYPVRSGNTARIASMLEALRAHGFAISLLVLARERDDTKRLRATRPHVDALRTLPFLPPSLPRARRALRRLKQRTLDLSRRTPLTTPLADALLDREYRRWIQRGPRATCPPALDTLLRHELDHRHVTAVLAEYCDLAPALQLPRQRGIRTLVDTHDVHWQRAERMHAAHLLPEGCVVSRADETTLLQHADLALAIQRHEAHTLSDMLGPHRVLLVEHALPPTDPLPPPTEPATLTWLASDNVLNRHALRWTLKYVWPLVLADTPHAELRIFGDLARVPELQGPRVSPRGPVETIDQAYRDGAVAINPVRVGTGLKIKSVEALAHGRPLVTTSTGAEGLEDVPDLAVHDAPHELARAITRWLHHPELARAAGLRAHTHVTHRFDPHTVYAPLLRALGAPCP